MIEQLVFNTLYTCTLLRVISDDGQMFAERTNDWTRHVENVIMMF